MRKVIIIVSEDYISEIDDVVERLKGKGFELSQSLRHLGTLIGRCPEDRIVEIEDDPGVHSVTDDTRMFHV